MKTTNMRVHFNLVESEYYCNEKVLSLILLKEKRVD